MLDLEELVTTFGARFGAPPRLFYAPGRVNLIGEHTDYNEGFVLPFAIDRGTAVAAAPRADRRLVAFTSTLDELAEIDLDAPPSGPRGVWSDYVEGIARVLESREVRLSGANLVIASDIPLGSGLSSSAAIEVSVALALIRLAGASMPERDLALACQKAEHEYAGTRSGVMDQMVSVSGLAGHALLIDCRSLEVEAVSMDVEGVVPVVCDSRVRHSLASSEYNTRRAECERGVELLARRLQGIRALRDVSPDDLERNRDVLPDVVYRRCRHVVTENRRTMDAVAALRSGDAGRLGAEMAASHLSLRDDYEVSCDELDELVEAAGRAGAVGARMTGGGFGGCTINLVPRDGVEDFMARVAMEYEAAFGLKPHFYPVRASGGAREVLTQAMPPSAPSER